MLTADIRDYAVWRCHYCDSMETTSNPYYPPFGIHAWALHCIACGHLLRLKYTYNDPFTHP